ncbi:MAG: hypothetical protein ACOZAA_10920 [Pseudomonadota bacterium]
MSFIADKSGRVAIPAVAAATLYARPTAKRGEPLIRTGEVKPAEPSPKRDAYSVTAPAKDKAPRKAV